jgi:hypothetical protein
VGHAHENMFFPKYKSKETERLKNALNSYEALLTQLVEIAELDPQLRTDLLQLMSDVDGRTKNVRRKLTSIK